MATLVVTLQGAVLRCTGGQVRVEQAGRTVERLPQQQVERVLLLGGVGLSTGFLNFALARRVPVTFLSQDGHYKGRLDSGGLRDVASRLAQARGLADLDWRLSVAKPLVCAKIAGERHLLQRIARNAPDARITTAVASLKTLAASVEEQQTLPTLMGIEGAAARVYFGALPAALRRPMPFRGRSRRPPRDPVNALLSLGYGLLTAEIIGALFGVGLDPQIGIFHSSRGRMPALAEDLLELFRAPVADSLALALVNLGVLQEKDFTLHEDGGVLLSQDALKVYFRHYRRRMQASFRDRNGHVTSFRRELQAQASQIRRVILREAAFVPYLAPVGGPR